MVAELHGFERLLTEAFAAGGRLAAAIIPAQGEVGLSPIGTHQVLAAISAANQAVSAAISHSAGGHRLLERLAETLSIDPTAYGDGLKPPKVTGSASSPAEIRAVS